MQPDLRRAVEERRRQWERFAAWEDAQRVPAPGPRQGEELRRALQWYDDALQLATRAGTAGPGAPERHLEDLVEWVRLWRRAWRAE